ncbi:MAG: hypothetical protein E7Z91_05950 [Cyanobacteria bacterium SIG30]|nr:hypothetical protein [Cyanobacteria bacterium SIG30]
MKKRWFKRTAERNTVGEEAIKQFKDVTGKAKIHILPQEQKADMVLNGLSDIDYQKEVIQRIIDITT